MSGSDDNAWERRGNCYDLFERVNVKQVHPVTGQAEYNISQDKVGNKIGGSVKGHLNKIRISYNGVDIRN